MYVCNTEKDTWELRAGLRTITADRKIAEIILWSDAWTIEEFDYESPEERLQARSIIWTFICSETERRGLNERPAFSYNVQAPAAAPVEKEGLPVWLL